MIQNIFKIVIASISLVPRPIKFIYGKSRKVDGVLDAHLVLKGGWSIMAACVCENCLLAQYRGLQYNSFPVYTLFGYKMCNIAIT